MFIYSIDLYVAVSEVAVAQNTKQKQKRTIGHIQC